MPVRLGLIGCGGIARAHLRGYAAIKEKEPELFDLVAVCDSDVTRAEAFAQEAAKWQATPPRVYADYRAMLEQEQLDAAEVCSPHYLHHTVGIACLDAGVHVQIEKPIGITIRATQKLLEAQRRSGKILSTAEQIRRQPGPRTAHWLIHEKKLLGDIQAVVVQRVQHRAPDPNAQWAWRAEKALGGGGLVLDSGAHFCDTMRYLFGEVESVFGRVAIFQQRLLHKGDQLVPDEREDTFFATLNFANGITGLWTFSTGLAGYDFNNVAYYGTNGVIVDPGDVFHGPRLSAEVRLRDGSLKNLKVYFDEYRAELGPEGTQRLFPHGFTDGFTLEIYDFLTAIRDGRPVEVDGETGLRAKAISEAIYESALAGQALRVADVIAGRYDAYQRPIDEQLGLV